MSLKRSHSERIQLLQMLGLTQSQSLVYLCLLESELPNGISGYEVAARAEIPRSAVYSVLNSLVDKGAVAVQGKPQRFFSVPHATWLADHRLKQEALIKQIKTSLDPIARLQDPAPIWIIRRYRKVISNIQILINSADQFLCLSLCAKDLTLLDLPPNPDFPVIVHCPSPVSSPLSGSCWFEQGPEPEYFNRIVLADNHHCLQGAFLESASNEVVLAQNAALYYTASIVFEQRIIRAAQRLAINADSDCQIIQSQRRNHVEP